MSEVPTPDEIAALVKQLRRRLKWCDARGIALLDIREAADALEALAAENAALHAQVEMPVWLRDPSLRGNVQHHLTPREAAALILTYQAMEADRDDNEIDPDTGYPEMVPIRTALGIAHEGEGYAEHVEQNVLPYHCDPHPFTSSDGTHCEVCGEDRSPSRPAQVEAPTPLARLAAAGAYSVELQMWRGRWKASCLGHVITGATPDEALRALADLIAPTGAET